MDESSELPQTVLILAPTSNDGALAVQVLYEANISALACTDANELCLMAERGCGAVMISEEALTHHLIACLHEVSEMQDAWSDLPIILLTSADVVRATELFAKSGNISLLERPFSKLTLVRSAQVALRARQKQYQVRDLLVALRRSKEESERANLAKTEFLANMSHEIRTPIGAIMGFIDLMKQAESGDEANEKYMGIIDRNSQQLLRLIDDILDLSKVEAGKMSVEQLNFRLNDFLADFFSYMRIRATEKGLAFHVKITDPFPERIITDPVRLRQILSNVVGNAIKFTEYGSISVSIGFHQEFLVFTVTDTGLGLNDAQAAKLFRPFTQADTSTTRKFGGTGLGLVLSRRLAEALGGDVSLVRSKLGNGCTFDIRLKPVIPPCTRMFSEDLFQVELTSKAPSQQDQDLHGLKILLVEDSPDNQFLISTYLLSTGASVEVRNNGAEGTEAALTENHDLILMDVQMPVMDGHEATRKLRRLQYAKPIIALTAHAMVEEKLRCYASGFNDYLTKPIERGVLIEVLKKYSPQYRSP